MHELAICQALLEQVTNVARANNASRVAGITVLVGPLAGVEAHLLYQAFAVAREGTIASNARLAIKPDPVKIHCEYCNTEETTPANRLRCSICGRPGPRLVGGDALVLAGIDVARPDTQLPSTGTDYV